MVDFATQLQTYFVQSADATPPSEPLPQTFAGCRVTPLIDGAAYFGALDTAVSALTGASGDFVLIAGWLLGLSGGNYEALSAWNLVGSAVGDPSGPTVTNNVPLALDGPGGTHVLQDMLIQKAQAGVDVRVMGWASETVSGSALSRLLVPYAAVNGYTMESIKKLRAEPKISAKAMLNVIAHPAGAIHSKMAVIGTAAGAIGFTGGIDLDWGRYAHPGHYGKNETWHDVAVQVEGPAVQALYDWFKDMWWENLSRPVIRFQYESAEMPSFLPGTPVLPARALPAAPVGTQHVQSLRTVPQFNYKWYNCLPESPAITFAPQGCFEVRIALRKALRAAQTYVYMEDQSFTAQETLSWVNEAIRARPALRVILVTNGAADPSDPAFPAGFLCHAINHGLLEGLTPAQIGQVRMFKRFGDTPQWGTVTVVSVAPEGANRSRLTLAEMAKNAEPADAFSRRAIVLRRVDDFHVTGNPAIAKGQPIVVYVDNLPGPTVPTADQYVFLRPLGITVHSKSTLIDDIWAIVGSANTMRRSLYTDLEHSIAFMDENGDTVRDFRTQLFADNFRHPVPADFNDIAASLHAWEPTWGVAGAAPTRPVQLENLPLPLMPDSTDGVDGLKYNNFVDPDSRVSWGGLCQ